MSVGRHCALNRDKSRGLPSRKRMVIATFSAHHECASIHLPLSYFATHRCAPAMRVWGRRFSLESKSAWRWSRRARRFPCFCNADALKPIADGNPDCAQTELRSRLSQSPAVGNELKVRLLEYFAHRFMPFVKSGNIRRAFSGLCGLTGSRAANCRYRMEYLRFF